ncbi:MAG TPA: glycosyltransferase family 87 protein [Vitreimonas sp.]|nr:glycosyltransferase family 87 protein [Vitreimonas sp.]
MPTPRSFELGDLVDRPTRRRAGVWQRALRREASRLRDRRRVIAMVLLMLTFGFIAAALLARGEQGGADARAYWAGVRIWLNGGDPYNPQGPFLPYIYAPWMLPLFAPWALLPWDVAWFVWRGTTILLWLWTIDWAYRRRPLETAVLVAALGFSFGANLDLGNITLLLALALFGAQFVGPRLAALLWAIATWMKWFPAPFLLLLEPRARRWGLALLAGSVVLTLATLPQTMSQMEAIFGLVPRPIRVDYFVMLWALVPWLWRRDQPFDWLQPSYWRERIHAARAWTDEVRRRWQSSPTPATAARRDVARGIRAFLGLGP